MCTSRTKTEEAFVTVDMLAKTAANVIPLNCVAVKDERRLTTECDSSCGDDQLCTTPTHPSAVKEIACAAVKIPPSPRRTRPIRSGGGQKAHQRHLVTQHDYHDHAADPVDYNLMESSASFTSSSSSSSSKSKRDSALSLSHNSNTSSSIPFPLKLYEMIDQMESDGLAHVMSWQPHGRCFQVHEAKAFKQMLPNYFKLSKIASFQRQLNLYGFQRLTAGLDKGSYYHELFLRNRRDLVAQIQRVKVKGTGVRAKANPEDEPNLYMYPAVDDLAVPAVCDVVPSTSMEDLKPRSVPSLNSVVDITSLERMDYTGMILEENVPRYTEVSDFYELPTSRLEIMKGLAHSLSSMNVLSCDDEISFSSNKLWKAATFKPPNLLRNVSSSFFDVARPSAPMGCLENDLDQMDILPEEVRSFTNCKDATMAVDSFLLGSDGNDQVSFDKLIDEMFSHNQDIDFSELVKLATEV